jgi:uncharacterized membrane protein
MNTSTHTATFEAPKERVFSYISDVENLPKWANGFCQKIRKEGADYIVSSPGGEIYFQINHDQESGVLDMEAGPRKDQTMTWPARVASLPNGGSIFMFTAIQAPDMPDDAFAAQCAEIEREFDNIRRAVE